MITRTIWMKHGPDVVVSADADLVTVEQNGLLPILIRPDDVEEFIRGLRAVLNDASNVVDLSRRRPAPTPRNDSPRGAA